jgi:glutaredoxin-related protein
VFIYMKGTPDAPMCGFSNMACRVLDAYGEGAHKGRAVVVVVVGVVAAAAAVIVSYGSFPKGDHPNQPN